MIGRRVNMEDELYDVGSLDTRAEISAKDKNEAELLIEEFRPYLHGCVTKYSLYATTGLRDDLYSVAMLAFYEAIQHYDKSKGHFLAFANAVIRRRIIDNIRKVYRQHSHSPIDLDDENSSQSEAISTASILTYQVANQRELLVLEIEQFKAELTTWDITLDTLVKQSPKHKKSRDICSVIVDAISKDPEIMHIIQIKRYFPVKKIAALTQLPYKKIERFRNYILASLIILTGDYEYMAEYIGKGR